MLEPLNARNRRIAMLIDGDNAQPSILGKMLTEANKYGIVSIRRIYGDWTENTMKGWKESLHTYAVQPIQQFRYSVGKNATDSAMIIDAMDILHGAGAQGFCLVSSDGDYTRLATRIREQNLFVMGIGKRNTPRAFVNACDVFVYVENLNVTEPPPTLTLTSAAGRSEEQEAPRAQAAPAAESSSAAAVPDLRELFRSAFDLVAQDNGWALLSRIGNQVRRLDPSFDPRTYGYKQLLPLLKGHPEIFEMRLDKGGKDGGRSVHYVRLKPRETPVVAAAAPVKTQRRRRTPAKRSE